MSIMLKSITTVIAACAALSSTALAPDFYSGSSVLSSGRWVKIRVSESGIQQITNTQLEQWGFDDPSKVTVYGFGGVVPAVDILNSDLGDDLPQQTILRLDDRILFYGESNVRAQLDFRGINYTPGAEPVRNTATDAGYYFLTDSRPEETLEPIAFNATSGSQEISRHRAISFFEEELTNPASAGQLFFGRDISDGTATEVSFDIPDRDCEASDEICLSCVLVGSGSMPKFSITYSGSGSTQTSPYTITRNTGATGSQYIFTTNYNTSDALIRISTMPDGVSRFNLSVSAAADAAMDYGALDYAAIHYLRYNRLGSNNYITMTFDEIQSGSKIVVSDANSDVRIWDIGNPCKVTPYTTEFDPASSSVSCTTNRSYSLSSTSAGCRAIAFDPAKEQNSVEYAGEVANQDLHSLQTPDMLIISSDVCMEQAERLAEIHRQYLGHDVIVIGQEQIFNEFSSGSPSPCAYRRFAKMLYDRNSSKMRHLLLFGGGSYDNLGLSPTAKSLKEQGAALMTYGTLDPAYMGTETKSYSADAYFGFMSDNFRPSQITSQQMSINVGRIPATDAAKAATAVDKIESYLTQLPSVDITHRAIVVADAGDRNSHMSNAENICNALQTYSPGITIVKAYNSIYPWKNSDAPYARAAIAQALKMGSGIFMFTGHGKPDSFSAQNLWNISYVNSTEYDFYPLAMFATCNSYTFDRISSDITESMLYKRDGGMIAIIGACRTVYENSNQLLGTATARAYGEASESTTTGDIFRNARNRVIAENINSSTHTINTLCYNLAGDPGLPVYAASPSAVIETVNGVALNAASHTLVPLEANEITGYIKTSTGSVDTEFNGTVILSIYESPKTVNTLSRSSAEISVEIDMDEDLLAQTAAEVSNGRFSATMTPPLPSRSGQYNRLTVLAYTSDLKQFAKTYSTVITVNPDNENASTDTEGPEITELYIDSPDFNDGDAVPASFRVYATIGNDPSGIMSTTGSIGGEIRITIDGSRVIPVLGTSLTYMADGSISLSCPVNSITDGRHELTINVSDNSGNTSSESISFIVISEPADATLQIAETPARTEATIALDHNFPEEPSGRLVIEDCEGNTILSRDNCQFPFSWDLTDGENMVADGIYRAYAILKSGVVYGSTPKTPIVVIQSRQ